MAAPVSGAENYTPGTLEGSAHLQSFVEKYNLAVEKLGAMQEQLSRAVENLQAQQEYMAARQRESQGWFQILGDVLAVVVGVAAVIVTLGAAVPVVVGVVVVAAGSALYGAAEIHEGIQNVSLGAQGDTETETFNFVRDTVFSGNQDAYDFVGGAFVFVASLTIPVGGFFKALGTGTKLSLPVVGKIVGIVGREIAEDKLSSIVGLGAGSLGTYLFGPEVGVAMGIGFSVLTGIVSGKVDFDDILKRVGLKGGLSALDTAADGLSDAGKALDNVADGLGDAGKALDDIGDAVKPLDNVADGLGDAGKAVDDISAPKGLDDVDVPKPPDVEKPIEPENVASYGPHNPHPTLSESVQNSFNGGTFSEVVTAEDVTLYRVYGGSANEIGGYWSVTPQNGGLQSQLDLALLPEWGNTAENITQITVPAGTKIYTGTAAPQDITDSWGNVIGTLPGGGSQIYIPEVNPSWLK